MKRTSLPLLRRREFITLLGGAAAGWPVQTRAQQSAAPVIGFLHSAAEQAFVHLLAAFRNGLNETGFVEGQNLTIEFRWAIGQDDRLPALASDLVRLRVAAIVAPTTPAALAAKAATTTIPIVFTTGYDPIALGLVTSLNCPGGNVTGIGFQTVELAAKRLGLLHELAGRAGRLSALVNPSSAWSGSDVKNLEVAASSIGLRVEILYADTDGAIDAAFENLALKPGALLISPDALFTSRRAGLATLAIRHAIPAGYACGNFPTPGG